MIQMKRHYYYSTILVILIICHALYIYNKVGKRDFGHKVVVCIPVYGQSYALGEEAKRITNFDSLKIKYNGRIVTENLDYNYGYYDGKGWKQCIKKIMRYKKKSFELSIYGMAERLACELGCDTLICIFPGGAGMSNISKLNKGKNRYKKLIYEIRKAYHKSLERGWDFYVPAVCWMQGESDIVEYPDYDYKEYFLQMYNDLNTDIKSVTGQNDNIRIICYQTTTVTKGLKYKQNHYDGVEARIPTMQMELVRDNPHFWASGPTYPYDFVNESLHIDAEGQKYIGLLAAKSALGILRNEKREMGLVPLSYEVEGNSIRIQFNVPCPPLCIDTINVSKADNFGFNVIRKDDTDIISNVSIDKNTVVVECSDSPKGCKLRYGINGDFLKGGRRCGPRGNLRDSQSIISNWCFLFELVI